MQQQGTVNRDIIVDYYLKEMQALHFKLEKCSLHIICYCGGMVGVLGIGKKAVLKACLNY